MFVPFHKNSQDLKHDVNFFEGALFLEKTGNPAPKNPVFGHFSAFLVRLRSTYVVHIWRRIRIRRMKLSVQGSLIAHRIGLGPLNKDLQSV